MLFILVKDVLTHIFSKASEAGLLQPLSSQAIQHRISINEYDVVSFLRPIASDIDLSLDLLNLFGEASRLKTNVQKSNGFPIQCTEMN